VALQVTLSRSAEDATLFLFSFPGTINDFIVDFRVKLEILQKYRELQEQLVDLNLAISDPNPHA